MRYLLIIALLLSIQANSQVFYSISTTTYSCYGLSTDTKPVSPPNNCYFTEINTAKTFKSSGGTWSLVGIGVDSIASRLAFVTDSLATALATYTQTRLNDTADAIRTTVNTKQATLVSGTNIKTVNGNTLLGSGDVSITSAVAWGNVTGTLSNQTDLQNALNLKANLASPTFTGTVVFPSGQALIAPVLGTPTSGTLTNCTFPTLNQNTTGSAATLTTTRTLWGQNFNGSTNVTGDITLGTANIGMTGSIGVTGSRVTKLWTTDIESTNMLTVGGTSLSSTFSPIASPTFTGQVGLPAASTTTSPVNVPSGTLETTSEAGDMLEYDGNAFYGSSDAGNRGVISLNNVIRLDAAYTLANVGTEQQLFNASANGRITLETGTYFFEAVFSISAMSATSGNAAFDILGAGGATLGTVLYHVVGIDGNTATAGTQTGSTIIQGQTPASMVTAGTGTTLNASLRGTFEVTVAGTIQPAVTLVTAIATASVAAGSYFRVRRIGSTTLTTIGQWD